MRVRSTDPLEDSMIDHTQLARSLAAAAALAGFALTVGAQMKEPMAKDKVAIEAAFAKADANVDGKLSKEEAAMVPAVGAKFAELDKNKDGFLTLAEFAAGYMAA
jgi:Ca2+-binding EF-hand superfamily protein